MLLLVAAEVWHFLLC